MRKLIFAVAALAGIAFAAPASAQTYYAGYGWGPYVGVGWGPAYSYYDYGYRPAWGPAYSAYGWSPPAVAVYAAPPVASGYVVVREPRRVVRERRVVRYRDTAYGAYAYAPGYRAYHSPYVSVGIGPRYGWYYE
ncbi:MAG: hypothetical protein ABWZ64_09160 [Xanthobacteraceae bacterium]|jgi:hypothetical protein